MAAHPKIASPFDHIDARDLPDALDLTDEQRRYLTSLISAAMRVIEGRTTLQDAEADVFGEGEFFWPKNPTEPIMLRRYFRPEKLRMGGLSLSFERVSEEAGWRVAQLTALPRNFPRGAFRMALPPEVFAHYKLIDVKRESKPDARIQHPIVFYFVHKTIPGLGLSVEAREDMVSTKDPYPHSFHALRILRDVHG